ncbi:MAG: hypothetical protein MJ003_05125 [Paludibacteraceae bacterium]|nr:hypothetical protein [Paludibacteraceae bacterium]
MKITECPWELANLDCRVAEISVDINESIDETVIVALEQNHDYLVLKVESGDMRKTILAEKMGYLLAETQLSIQKAKKDWNVDNNKLTQMIISQTKVEPITTENSLTELLEKITDKMFSTDRIYLDPEFGPVYSARRYKNWVCTEFEKGALLNKILFRGKYVGFSLCKKNGENLNCLLAGNFEQYQKTGIGYWIPLTPLFYEVVDYNLYTTRISTNNFPVWQMYNWHNYIVSKFEYVFIKHIRH